MVNILNNVIVIDIARTRQSLPATLSNTLLVGKACTQRKLVT